MRLLATTVLYRYLLPGLLAGSLGACQRAGYQFQPAGNAAPQAITPVPASESAVIRLAAPPPARLLAAAHLPRLHRAARPTVARVPRAAWLAPRLVATARPLALAPQQRPVPVAKPVRHRSKGLAILLAILSITYLPLSLHNFYLGYYGRGAAAIALVITGAYLVLLGFLTSIFSGGGMVGLGLVGLAMLGVWFIWQLTDLVRIITGNLQPKDGAYNSKFFQLKPDASGTLSAPRTD
jgi:hypothetical protein